MQEKINMATGVQLPWADESPRAAAEPEHAASILGHKQCGRGRLAYLLFSAALSCVHPNTACLAQESDAAKPADMAGTGSASEPKPGVIENSVVKDFATLRQPDLWKPWTKLSANEVTGSGVVIEGKRILSNAHMVLYAGQVQVQANQAGDKISATVEAVAPGIDLAVLKLDDESFFATHPPLPRASTCRVSKIRSSPTVTRKAA